MSENNANVNKNDKPLVDGLWIRQKNFDNGGSILKVGILVDKFVEFIQKNKKANGYVDIVISEKRIPPTDEKQTSHYSYLDTYESKSPAKQPAAKTPVSQKKAAPAPAENDDSSF